MNNQIRTTVQVIQPNIAEILLHTNTNNRKVRPTRVALYAHEMRNGKWQMTGEPIIISRSGNLLNGQHRLLAVIESGVPLTTVVVEGIEDEAFTNMDNNLTRKTSDVLYQAGVPDTAHSAAVARLYIAVEAGINPTNTAAMNLVTRSDISGWVLANSDRMSKALMHSRALNSQCGGNRTGFGALYLLIEDKAGQEWASDYCDSIYSGSNLMINDPRLTFRNWSIRMKGKSTAVYFLASGINACNAFREGRPLSFIRPWTNDRPFPVIK